MRLPLLLAIAIATAGTHAAAATPDLENLDTLDAKLAIYLGGSAADAGRLAVPIDRRLRLRRCAEGAVFDPAERGAIGIQCASAGWRIRVPTARNQVQVAQTVIRRGDAIQIITQGNGFNIANGAVAQEDGVENGTVRVKTLTGGTLLTGRVQGAGVVAVGD